MAIKFTTKEQETIILDTLDALTSGIAITTYNQDGEPQITMKNQIIIPQYYIYYNYNGVQAYITKEQLLENNDEAAALEL